MGKRKIDPDARKKEEELKALFMKRIRQAIRDAGMSQADLAKKMNATESTVSRWVCGIALPEAVYMPSLARELKVSVDWLLGVTDADQNAVRADKERLTKLDLAMDVIKLTIADLEKKDED